VLGQPVMKKDWGNLNAGVSTIELDLGIIPSGLYWLSVVNANGVPVQSIPLVVQ